jgi:glutaminyl-peptide cyclotransferase
LLIGTHYDTRLIADRELDERLKSIPIPGANDGGSGSAIQIELARILKENKAPVTTTLAWFDGEDLGGISDLDYAVGSKYFTDNMPCEKPDEVIILDMVAGMNMHLNIDGNSLRTQGARKILTSLFDIGRRLELEPWFNNNPNWIFCDHIPFIDIGIPAVLLIDINYPQWHTQSDLPRFCSSSSLYSVGQVLVEYIYKGKVRG